MRRTAGSRPSPTRGTRCAASRRTAHWEKPQGKNEPLQDGKALSRSCRAASASSSAAARSRRGTAFPACSRSRDRQRGRRQAASGGDPAARAHGEDRARGAGRSRLRSERRDAGRARRRRRHRAEARAAARGAGSSTSPAAPRTATGSRRNARQAQVYTEKSGVNQIVVDSTADFKGVARNVAFSLSLYTGQMCTAPQNIYVPKDGIDTADGHLTFDQVAAGIAERVQKLLGDPARAVEILGAVRQRRRDAAARGGAHARPVVLDTQSLAHPPFPTRRIRTPLIVKLDAADRDKYLPSGSARSRSSSRPSRPTRASRSRATR